MAVTAAAAASMAQEVELAAARVALEVELAVVALRVGMAATAMADSKVVEMAAAA
jgi:hypothetical protein